MAVNCKAIVRMRHTADGRMPSTSAPLWLSSHGSVLAEADPWNARPPCPVRRGGKDLPSNPRARLSDAECLQGLPVGDTRDRQAFALLILPERRARVWTELSIGRARLKARRLEAFLHLTIIRGPRYGVRPSRLVSVRMHRLIGLDKMVDRLAHRGGRDAA